MVRSDKIKKLSRVVVEGATKYTLGEVGLGW